MSAAVRALVAALATALLLALYVVEVGALSLAVGALVLSQTPAAPPAADQARADVRTGYGPIGVEFQRPTVTGG